MKNYITWVRKSSIAPWCRSMSTASVCPKYAAQCNGVHCRCKSCPKKEPKRDVNEKLGQTVKTAETP